MKIPPPPPPPIMSIHSFNVNDPTPNLEIPVRTIQPVYGDLTPIGNISARQRAENARLRSGIFTAQEIRNLMNKGY